MSDPRRLRHETSDAFSRALLDSVRSDTGPTSGARERALAAFGIGTAALVASSSAATAAKAAGTAALGSKGGGVLGSAVTLGLVKWFGIALVGGAIATATLHYARTGVEVKAPRVPDPIANTVQTEAPPVAPVPVVSRVEDIAPAVEAPQAASAAVRARPPTTSRSPVASASALQEQTEMLDMARALLEKGDARGALAQLDKVNRRYANGALSEETTVMRIEALRAAGDHAASDALARHFLAEHAQSAYAQRVRTELAKP